MKPIKIEFQAFGPYTGHEVVDFEKISSKGLFLICGKTGIGKTMILDAMTFALYGKSSGNARDDFEAMRSTSAEPTTPTFVKFIFENNGEYYLFERRLEKKRTNFSASYNVQKKGDDGIWRNAGSENPKASELNKLAEEIIGLEYGQFSQVIVLPQGKFEKLLTSNSDDKEKILTSIFGEEKWKIIAEKFFEDVQNTKSQLDDIKKRIDASLKEEDCDTFSDLRYVIVHKERELEALEEELKKADLDSKKEDFQKQLMLVNSFKDLHKHEENLKELKENKTDRDDWAETLVWGAKAEKTRKFIEDFDTSNDALQERTNSEILAVKKKDKQEKLFIDAEKKHKKLIGQEKEIEEKKKLKIQYEGKIPDYEGLEGATEEVDRLKKDLKRIDKQVSDAKKILDGYAPILIELTNKYNDLDAEHSALLNDYLAGITGELASKLEKGKPCPVCGSTEHPKKAQLSENSISKEKVDAKKRECDSAYKKINETNKQREESQKNYEKIKNTLDESNKIIIEKEAKLETMKKNMVEGIDSIDDLKTAIAKLGREIDSYDKAVKDSETNKNNASKALASAESNCKTCAEEKEKAEKKYKEAEKALIKSLEENEFESIDVAREFILTPEEVEDYQKAIAEYDTNVKNEEKQIKDLKKTLDKIEEPDEAVCKQAIKEIDDRKVDFETNKATLNSEIKRLSDKEENLKKDAEGLEEKLRIAAEDLVFAKKLRGDSGTGLQRYVLGIMFSQVIASANKMLELVHGGRYRLFRSEDKVQGSNKRGLDLKVHDSHSEDKEGRFVSTLSGGEKFLASLALSIGMSTIAQKSGIKIEALFIDEGFGSLDEDSIGDAMNILNSIQEANGLVGIISHVQILQDRIPSKLLVEQQGKGSHIVQTIG